MERNRKKGLWLIGGGIAAIGLFFMARSAKNLKDLDINIDYVHLDKSKSNISTIYLTLGVNVYNPNTEPLPFESFYGNIYMYDKLIANIDPYRNASLILRGRQSTILKLAVSIPSSKMGLSIVTSITDLLDGKASKIPITMKGTMKAGGLTVPVNQDLSIDLT